MAGRLCRPAVARGTVPRSAILARVLSVSPCLCGC